MSADHRPETTGELLNEVFTLIDRVVDGVGDREIEDGLARVLEAGGYDHEPRCLICGNRQTVIYGCTACPYTFEVPGEFRYFPQGRGHFHVPDDDARFKRMLFDHVDSHPEGSGMMPR